MMVFEEARAQLLASANNSRVNRALEKVATLHANGRVLAEDVFSPINVPGFDNSAMDGYAVRIAEIQDPLKNKALPVSARIPAGSFPVELTPSSVARIFTGAAVPKGADAVIMQERVTLEEASNIVSVQDPMSWKAGEAIRRAGEDIALGSLVAGKGSLLTPALLGLISSVGIAAVNVFKPLRVACFFTGDELTMPGEPLKPGGIYNSNRFVLTASLAQLGCEVIDLGNVPDSLEATKNALREAAGQADLIVTSGGVSVGEEDHVKAAVQAEGSLNLWQISMKPGKPLAYGTVGKAHFLGLPGNPVSSVVTFMLLGVPFIKALQGASDQLPLTLMLPAGFEFLKADRRREFLRASIDTNGQLQLHRTQSSGALTSIAYSQGLIDNPPNNPIRRGDLVRFMPFAAGCL